MAVMKFCTKLGKARKDMFPIMINYFFEICVAYANQSQSGSQPPLQLCCQKEGSMGALGQLAELLRYSKAHKSELEPFVMTHILPDVRSPHGFLRYRVCWMLQQFSEGKLFLLSTFLILKNRGLICLWFIRSLS